MILSNEERETFLKFSNINLPRHTSYPIVPIWRKDWGHFDFEPELISKMNEEEEISLYVHVPFCRKLCSYCACNKIIVPDSEREKLDPAGKYLFNLGKELKIIHDLVGRKKVKQLHLGGGSPTFLTKSQLNLMVDLIDSWFDISEVDEMAIEVDPRVTTREQLELLKQLGFNRISLGIQDFDPKVQEAIGRMQPYDMVETFVNWVRELNFDSLNFDLIYGLPYQTKESISDTLKKVTKLSPDRIAYYRLALMPEIFKWQKTFKTKDIPSSEDCLDFLELAVAHFSSEYEMIGFDHFSKKKEMLSVAKDNGSIRRNFQGMTTERKLPIIGVGPSAISDLNGVFSQNEKSLKKWSETLDLGLLPASVGLALSKEDIVRKKMMDDLYGLGKVDFNQMREMFFEEDNNKFDVSTELEKIKKLEELGIVTFERGVVKLTNPLGQLLSRVCGAALDPYLPEDAYLNGVKDFRVSKL